MDISVLRDFLWLSILWQISICDEDYNNLERDGSFAFGYTNPHSYHRSQGNRNNVVRGEFGSRNPGTGGIDSIQYSAGPRGFRPRGKNVVRKYDFNQVPTGPIGSPTDRYFDPNEDPSYNFAFNTGIYNRQEAANRIGDVTGKYSYVDDVGERHNVEFIAGKNTGFHVRSAIPDNKALPFSPIQYVGKRKPVPRGRTTVQRGLDGSYRFVSGGPDHRRTETSDSTGHVRGSYTYLDDKGVRHSVHYIAGPETGYRVLKNVKGPHLPTIFPFGRPEIIPPDFYDYPPVPDDVFDTAASGLVNPNKGGVKPSQDKGSSNFDYNSNDDVFGGDSGSSFGSGGKKPNRPTYEDDGSDLGDIFGTPLTGTSNKPQGQGSYPDDGSYKPTGEDGSYRPTQSGNDGGEYGDFGSGRPSGSGATGGKPNKFDGTGSGRPNDFGGGVSRPEIGASTGSGSTGGGDFRPIYGSRPTGLGGSGSGKPDSFDTSGGTSSGGLGVINASRPNRPTYDITDSNEANDFDVFGNGPPSAGGGGTGTYGGGNTGSSSSSGTGLYGGSGGSVTGGGGLYGITGNKKPDSFGQNEGSGVYGASGSNKPGTFGQNDGNSGLSTGIGIYGTGSGYNTQGTLVTNVGDRTFSVPPGVSVRAHVQAIDLLPLSPRSLSPGEQLKAESSELKAENTNTSPQITNKEKESTQTETTTQIAISP